MQYFAEQIIWYCCNLFYIEYRKCEKVMTEWLSIAKDFTHYDILEHNNGANNA